MPLRHRVYGSVIRNGDSVLTKSDFSLRDAPRFSITSSQVDPIVRTAMRPTILAAYLTRTLRSDCLGWCPNTRPSGIGDSSAFVPMSGRPPLMEGLALNPTSAPEHFPMTPKRYCCASFPSSQPTFSTLPSNWRRIGGRTHSSAGKPVGQLRHHIPTLAVLRRPAGQRLGELDEHLDPA